MLWLIPADSHEQRIGSCRLYFPPATHPNQCRTAAPLRRRWALLPIGHTLAETAETAGIDRLPAGRNIGCRPAVTNVSATNVIFVRFFKTLACPVQSSSGAAPGVIGLSHLRNKTVTRGSYGIGASGFHEGGPYEFRKDYPGDRRARLFVGGRSCRRPFRRRRHLPLPRLCQVGGCLQEGDRRRPQLPVDRLGRRH